MRLYKEAFIAFMAFIASQTPKVERWQWCKVTAQPFFPSRIDMFSHLIRQVESSMKLDSSLKSRVVRSDPNMPL